MNEDDPLTFEQGLEMLIEGDTVHTFLNPGGMLLGADWAREDALDLVRRAAAEGALWVSGPMATAMGHGLTAWDGPRPVFLETRSNG